MDKFEQLRSYLTAEMCGYDYTLATHKKLQEEGNRNSVQYIQGRLDAINAALEVASTLKD
jgi:hypothetical protein